MEDDVRKNLKANQQVLKQAVDELLNTDSEINKKKKSDLVVKKEQFIVIIDALIESQQNTKIVFNKIGVDLSLYEEFYLQIIDLLFLMNFGKRGFELISYYLYERKNPDGTVNEIMDKQGNKLKLETPLDLWKALEVKK